MIPKIIVGIGHRSGVGKDTLAKFLDGQLRCQQPGLIVKKVSLAWKLKEVCHSLYAWAGVKSPIHYENHREDRHIPISALGGITVVDLWVKFGTRAVREHVYDGTWLDYVVRGQKEQIDVLIVPDTRQENEALLFRSLDGVLIRVDNPRVPNREGVTIDDDLQHWKDWDYIFNNVGTIREIMEYAEKIAELILRRLA